jgi:hypothetical protein
MEMIGLALMLLIGVLFEYAAYDDDAECGEDRRRDSTQSKT